MNSMKNKEELLAAGELLKNVSLPAAENREHDVSEDHKKVGKLKKIVGGSLSTGILFCSAAESISGFFSKEENVGSNIHKEDDGNNAFANETDDVPVENAAPSDENLQIEKISFSEAYAAAREIGRAHV